MVFVYLSPLKLDDVTVFRVFNLNLDVISKGRLLILFELGALYFADLALKLPGTITSSVTSHIKSFNSSKLLNTVNELV